jgi:hypothetical protein
MMDFAERGALFTEAVEVMRGIWTTEEFRFEGRHFTALAQTALPHPIQRPQPPLWLGGNSAVQVESREGRIWADEPVLHRHHERVGELAEAGATWFVVDPPADDAENGLDALRRYGAEVIAALAR